jgi:hypothetical protein
MSSAPYPVTMEHRYGFAENAPTGAVDPDGEKVSGFLGPVIVGAAAAMSWSALRIACSVHAARFGCVPGYCNGWGLNALNAPVCGPGPPAPPVPPAPVPVPPPFIPGTSLPSKFNPPGSENCPPEILDGLYKPNEGPIPGYIDADGNPIDPNNPYVPIKEKVDELMRGRQ